MCVAVKIPVENNTLDKSNQLIWCKQVKLQNKLLPVIYVDYVT